MLNLGHRLLSVGRNEESLELFERAIAESEASGLDLRRGAMNRNNACEALFALGRWNEAIAQAVPCAVASSSGSRAVWPASSGLESPRPVARTILPGRCCPGWKPMARA